MKKMLKMIALVLSAADAVFTSGCTNLPIGFASSDQYSAGDSQTDSAVTALEFDWTSGKAALFVPGSADFKAAVDTASGKFDSDISLKKVGDTYTAGSGSNQIRVETTSGDIEIKPEG